MEKQKTISALIVLAFVIAPFLGILTVVPTAKALEVKEGNINKTKEGKTDMDLTWDTSSVGKPLTMNLSLNKGWSIDSATIGVSPLPYVTDAGTQWETVNYPDRPRMDVT